MYATSSSSRRCSRTATPICSVVTSRPSVRTSSSTAPASASIAVVVDRAVLAGSSDACDHLFALECLSLSRALENELDRGRSESLEGGEPIPAAPALTSPPHGITGVDLAGVDDWSSDARTVRTPHAGRVSRTRPHQSSLGRADARAVAGPLLAGAWPPCSSERQLRDDRASDRRAGRTLVAIDHSVSPGFTT